MRFTSSLPNPLYAGGFSVGVILSALCQTTEPLLACSVAAPD
ncbi:MAG: hypothetical protein ACXVH0_10080 [Thermoanaerobaculia bacterium]